MNRPLTPSGRLQRIRFSVFISADELLSYYAGAAVMASVVADDGRRIRFPARHLRPFITESGIKGRFEMTLDQNHRFVSMKRL